MDLNRLTSRSQQAVNDAASDDESVESLTLRSVVLA